MTIPHKRAVVAACDEADGEAVNTLVFRDGRVLGVNTDREILAGIAASARLRDRRRRRRARARAGAPGRHAHLQPPRRVAAGREGCDLIVNATPVRDELLVAAARGPDGRRPRLLRRRRRDGARRARRAPPAATVVDGLEALVRQGARSFELWTGVAAPVGGDARRGTG